MPLFPLDPDQLAELTDRLRPWPLSPPAEDAVAEVRHAAHHLMLAIGRNVPDGRERDRALDGVVDVAMWAVHGIAHNPGAVYEAEARGHPGRVTWDGSAATASTIIGWVDDHGDSAGYHDPTIVVRRPDRGPDTDVVVYPGDTLVAGQDDWHVVTSDGNTRRQAAGPTAPGSIVWDGSLGDAVYIAEWLESRGYQLRLTRANEPAEIHLTDPPEDHPGPAVVATVSPWQEVRWDGTRLTLGPLLSPTFDGTEASVDALAGWAAGTVVRVETVGYEDGGPIDLDQVVIADRANPIVRSGIAAGQRVEINHDGTWIVTTPEGSTGPEGNGG